MRNHLVHTPLRVKLCQNVRIRTEQLEHSHILFPEGRRRPPPEKRQRQEHGSFKLRHSGSAHNSLATQTELRDLDHWLATHHPSPGNFQERKYPRLEPKWLRCVVVVVVVVLTCGYDDVSLHAATRSSTQLWSHVPCLCTRPQKIDPYQ